MFARRQALGTLSKIGYLAAGLALGAVLLGTSTVKGAADATPPALGTQLPWPTLPVKEVRPGMTGYGLTVFQEPSRSGFLFASSVCFPNIRR